MITSVVFDLDDTLYDEIEYCKSGFNAVAKFLANLPDLSETLTSEQIFKTLWSEFSAGNHSSTFNNTLDRLGIEYEKDTILNLVSIYRNHDPNISLPKESKEILDRLSPEYALALLTDGFLPAQKLKVKALEIEGYFEYIIYTEELGREFWKPSPEGFKQLLKKIKQRPEKCVYVADNAEKDFIAPNKLGFTTIQLVGSTNIHKGPPAVPEAAPDHIITSITHLPTILGRL
jgi:putative hydrolase of the HAD superfamily